MDRFQLAQEQEDGFSLYGEDHSILVKGGNFFGSWVIGNWSTMAVFGAAGRIMVPAAPDRYANWITFQFMLHCVLMKSLECSKGRAAITYLDYSPLII